MTSVAHGADQVWPGFGDARIENIFADDPATSVLVQSAPGRDTVIVTDTGEKPAGNVAASNEPAPRDAAAAAPESETPAAATNAVAPDASSIGTPQTAVIQPSAERDAVASNAGETREAAQDKTADTTSATDTSKAAPATEVGKFETDIPPATAAAPAATAPVATAPADTPASVTTTANGASATAPAAELAKPEAAGSVAVGADNAASDAKANVSKADAVKPEAVDTNAAAPAATDTVATTSKPEDGDKLAPVSEPSTSSNTVMDAGRAGGVEPTAANDQDAGATSETADAPPANSSEARPGLLGASTGKGAANPSALASEIAHPKPVYYDKRAQEILEADAPQEVRDELKEDFPQHSMVSCIAGCGSGKAEVVQVTPVSEMASGTTGEVVPTSADATIPAAEAAITCIAGCYDTPHRKFHSPSRAEIDDDLKQSATSRLSGAPSGKRIDKRADKSNADWMTSRRRTAAAPAINKPSRRAHAAHKVQEPSGAWLTRINKSRRMQFD